PITAIDGGPTGEESKFIGQDIPSKNPLASHSVLAFFCMKKPRSSAAAVNIVLFRPDAYKRP
ncbi:MAG: hypothetical protein ACTH5V_18960, partial [Serratia proteamaculans]